MALVLNGSSQYASRAHSASLNMNFTHYVSFWVKPAAAPSTRKTIFAKDRGSGLYSALYYWNSSSINLWISDSSLSDELHSAAYLRNSTVNLWTQLGWLWTSGSGTSDLTFVINGFAHAPISTSETALQTQSGSLYIGGDPSDLWNGRIQEVQVWSAQPSFTWLNEHWNKRLIDYPDLLAAQSGLRCYWPLVADYEDHGVQALNLDLSGVGSPTFAAEDPLWIEAPTAAPDTTDPVLSGVTPAAASQLNGDSTVQFDVTDETSLAAVFVAVRFADDTDERIYDVAGFAPRYSTSTATPISGGTRFVLRRTGGWLVNPVISVRAYDAGGNELATTISYSRPAAGVPAPSALASRTGGMPFAIR